MNLSFLLSAVTGTTAAAITPDTPTPATETLTYQIIKLVLPSVVSIITYFITEHKRKKRLKKATSEK